MMIKILLAFISFAVGYLLGSINTSLIVSRLYKTDIRQHGSGNAGLTNALRVLGKKAALIVLAGDVLKGVLACLAGLLIAGEYGVLASGLGAVAGHNWPVYFKFKGGKGVLTSIAVIAFIDWRMMIVLFFVFVIVLLISKYVSISSMVSAALFPVIVLLFGKAPVYMAFSVIIAALIIFRHSKNIERLKNGTESRFTFKKLTHSDSIH